ncbi:MAG: PadR family transcriptional regulator [Gammaproteobacteria bacterium]|nr:PadR family transcriptional regulator [Gammaproteobacteria bacterium]MAY02063.1 PadR family transcriptional regulator [Gammaproteobacteria bacterium]|tara:strand:- start:797 stop:1117 length:321 start_codon:yes stop_codon:yes gene_type:complete
MNRIRKSSKQTISVLKALLNDYPDWSYGYELSKQAELKSGTLYPILMRLSDRDYLDSKWEESPEAGRPPRHMYRLSTSGLRFAEEQIETSNAAKHAASFSTAGKQA